MLEGRVELFTLTTGTVLFARGGAAPDPDPPYCVGGREGSVGLLGAVEFELDDSF